MKWQVVNSYLTGCPEYFEARTDEELECQVRVFAENYKSSTNKLRHPIGPLQFEGYTDQVDVWFKQSGIKRRFLTLMAAE